jgi:serine/threonine-protein kinase
MAGANGWDGLFSDTGGFAEDGRSHTMVVHRDGGPEHLGRESFLGRWLFSRRLIVVVLVFVLAVGLGIGGWWFANGRYTPIPTLAGDTVTQATTALSQDGFRVTSGPQVDSNTVPKGQVVGTSPAGRALKGATIAILVSAGPFTSVVPSVKGDTVAGAKSALAKLHLSTVTQQVGSTLPKGTVTGTSPAAGTKWAQTQPVTLLVSGGLPMPDFVGMQQSAAASLAATDHLTVTYVKQSNSSQPAGVVLSQSPSKNSPVHNGETVTLTVSSGPPETAVPNVVGQSVSQATSTLEAAGFTVNVLGSQFFGKVQAENPSGKAPYGSAITINVAFDGGGGGGGGGGGCIVSWFCP